MTKTPSETQFDHVERLVQAALAVLNETKQHDNYRTLVLTSKLDALSEALIPLGR